jgi:CheY-like chemotaxis protein
MEHAEELWETVRRLRFFSEKLQSSSVIPQLGMKPTDIGQLLAGLVLEIEDYSPITLQVSLNTAPSLPLARASEDSLRTAIFFLIESVFELEPNASTLLLQAHALAQAPAERTASAPATATARGPDDDDDGEDSLHVRIDIEAIPEDGDEIRVKSPAEVIFSYNAATNLLNAQGAVVTLDHSPGLSAVASITMMAAHDDRIIDDLGIDADEEPHGFGGVLVMEGNPTIRHMLARELHKTKRNVIVCADGIAAASLFDATPERFELLILEQESRRMPGEILALKALQQNPDLKVILVTPAPGSPIRGELRAHPDLRVLHKPFGLMEFRETMGRSLGPAPVSVPATGSTAAKAL